jgi:hypothetical protein
MSPEERLIISCQHLLLVLIFMGTNTVAITEKSEGYLAVHVEWVDNHQP